MKKQVFILAALLACSALCFAKANGAWLKKVPQKDLQRVNPYADDSKAAAAGAILYRNNCARCHGENAEGRGSRPSLRSDRVRNATDGDLAWILKNGVVFKGMPRWGGLPEQERWQIVTYLRSLSAGAPGEKQ